MTYLNSNIDTSEANAAWFPYFPTIPIPILPIWIIPTSFPPSPIDALYKFNIYTVFPDNNFIFYVIIAFCVGKHLQQITLGALVAI